MFYVADKSNSKQRWRKGKEHGTSEGVKRLYHCSQRNCKALMSVVYCSNSPRVEVHRSPEEHQHDTPLDWGLTPEIKQASNPHFVIKVLAMKMSCFCQLRMLLLNCFNPITGGPSAER